MKILNVYRSEPDDTTKKLVEIVTRDREADSFDLNVDSPDYDSLVDKIFDADQTIKYWVDRFARYSPEAVSGFGPDDVSPKVAEALADDMNTPEAIAEVTRIAKSVRSNDPSKGRILAASASLLGFELSALHGYDEARAKHQAHHGELLTVIENALSETRINELLKLRVEARKAKDFKKADAIRDGLIAAGLELRDGPEGTTFSLSADFDPQKLEALK